MKEWRMPIWKRNLIVCWFGMFTAGVGMSQIAPILPIYIKHLGVHNEGLISQFSGIAFGSTFIISAIFSPIWGYAADKYGRKPMLLRASLGMAIVIFLMGFSKNVYELIGLRVLLGVISGYGSACTTLIATQTDEKHTGWALGAISTSNIAGSLLGPMIGGFIAEKAGLENVFYITGILLFISFLTTWLFVKESFTRQNDKAPGTKEVWNRIPDKSLTMIMLVSFFIISGAFFSIEPIITVYVDQLSHHASHVALISGLAFSIDGLANIIAAPRLGRMSDKIGPQKIIFISLIASGILFIPQALVTNPWQLIVLRFLFGLASAGLIPAINTLLKKTTPALLTGRVFGFAMSARYLGAFGGSIFGGQVAARLGISYIFYITSALLLINAAWVYFKIYKKPHVEIKTG